MDTRLIVNESFIIGVSLGLKFILYGIEFLISWESISTLDGKLLGGVVIFLFHVGRDLVEHVEFWVDIELRVHLKEGTLHVGWHDGEEARELVDHGLKDGHFFIRVSVDAEIGKDGLVSMGSDVVFRGGGDEFS